MTTLPWPRPVRLPDRSFADDPLRACADSDPNLFFDDNPEPAKQVCRRCPFTRECLSYAMDGRLDYGVWAATTGAERERARRKARHERGAAA